MSKLNPIQQSLVDLYGEEPKTLDEVAECIITKINNTVSHTSVRSIPLKVLGFKWKISYSNCVSNSHNSPQNGVTNWGRDPKLPVGYPGYSGRVWIRYKDVPSWGSDGFEKTLSYVGSGGAGSYNGPWADLASAHYSAYGHRTGKNIYPAPRIYSWDYQFFISDWPMLEKVHLLNVIANKIQITHKFEWYDPETVASDKKFLENLNKLETFSM